jgi:hypothetical protein
MKRQLLGVLICVLLVGSSAHGQLYRASFGTTAGTLVGNTVDTTASVFLYNNSSSNPRPIRPTLHIDLDEIGTNTTHNFLEIKIDVADRNLSKAADGWEHIKTLTYNDFSGYNNSSQNDLAIPLPFLESYAAQYMRLRLHYPFGSSEDSTSYRVYYLADESGSMYTPPETNIEEVAHFDLFNSVSRQNINGTGFVESVAQTNRVEVVPGVFRPINELTLIVLADTKVDDDSMTVYMYPFWKGAVGVIPVDTITFRIGVDSVSVAQFSPVPDYPDEFTLRFYNESGDSEDTTRFYAKLLKECQP